MNYASKIIMIICEITLGVLLFINPLGFTGAVIKLAGVLMLVAAVFSGIGYFRADPIEAHLGQGLSKALVLLALGLFFIFKTDWFLATFPIIAVIYGIAILVTGIIRVQWTVDMFRMKNSRWYVSGIGAVLSIVLAIVIILNPFSAADVLWKFVAISMLIDAAADLAIVIFVRTVEKSLDNEIEYKD